MKQRVGKLPGNFDLQRLQLETTALVANGKQDMQQISLQTDGSDNWHASTGSRPGQEEAQWNHIHPELKGTWWEDFFAALPMPVFRSRIMTMQPRTCYSIHKDDNPRLHIAIKTHRQAKFIFTSPPEIIHIPADGSIWWVDTREEHTAINGSLAPRLHLVMCLVNNDPD